MSNLNLEHSEGMKNADKNMELSWFNKGEHWVWMSASMVSISVILVFGLLLMISVKGLSHFWPKEVYELHTLTESGNKQILVGEVHDEAIKPVTQPDGTIQDKTQFLIKTGNRDLYGMDFKWTPEEAIVEKDWPLAKNILVFERKEWGNAYGYVNKVLRNGKTLMEKEEALAQLPIMLSVSNTVNEAVMQIEKVEIGSINYQIERLRLEQRKLELDQALTPEILVKFEQEKATLNQAYDRLKKELDTLYKQQEDFGYLQIVTPTNQTLNIPFKTLLKYWQPNEMNILEKGGFFFSSLWAFLSDDPREANTEGGVFPAIVGTITMVLLMTVLVTPLGVVAAIYINEYAKDGPVLRFVRISINNLAGVPSIVYGIFGLGFFVYILGGSIDEIFFPHALPSPTFGSPALLWASLTMALLTLPVVIVSTQEGLSRIPSSLREGGLALGATKAETIFKIIIPMSIPAIMTGLILAVARAAGEVAPLMLVGAVKLAPQLPVDFNAPFVHLEQKFMHLGFHIYDVGFQSPHVEASQPLVYATSLLLVFIIVVLNLAAILIRNRLRERYKALSH